MTSMQQLLFYLRVLESSLGTVRVSQALPARSADSMGGNTTIVNPKYAMRRGSRSSILPFHGTVVLTAKFTMFC